MGEADGPAGGRSIGGALSDTPLADEYRLVEKAFTPGRRSDLAFDRSAHPAAVVEKARGWWLEAMRVEYESASVFIELAANLRLLGDPLDVQTVALRMAQDELRHAAISGQVVVAMGDDAKILASGARPPPPHADCGPEENVLRTILFGCCLSETVNAARLAKSFAETGDLFVREAFRRLLADERLHAQFGYYYLEFRRRWLEERPEVRRTLGRYLRFAFAALERLMGAVPVDAQPRSEAERAIGLPDLTSLSQTYQETIVNAAVPGIERFDIAAATAWRERSTTAPPKSES